VKPDQITYYSTANHHTVTYLSQIAGKKKHQMHL